METIIGDFAGVPEFTLRNDDDSSDKLSHRYTTIIFLVFAVVVSTAQFVGDPIDCWVPAHFTGNHEAYTDSYCWIKNTYYLPFTEYIPKAHEHDKRQVVPYYQWVPIFLLVQALMFYMPVLVWRLNARSGINVNHVVESAEKYQKLEEFDESEKMLRLMTKETHRYLKAQQHSNTKCTVSMKNLLAHCCLVCGRRYGNYLTSLYLFTKILYICNVFLQLFLMTWFLGSENYLYGVEVIEAMANGDELGSVRFPRVTMCDFNIRRLGNLQRYTVQCVLTINLFNEKIYMFLWFWLVFVAAVSCISLLRWACRSLFGKDQYNYVKKHLLYKDVLKNEEKDLLKKFVKKYLKKDGVLLARLVAVNTNSVIVSDYLASLWNHYKEVTIEGEVDV